MAYEEKHEAVCVAIVGGGISGFALSLALQKVGIRSIIFEKDASFEARVCKLYI